MKTGFTLFTFSILILLNSISYSLVINPPDSSELIPIQYRRGTDLQQGFQTYEQKYEGKNLIEERRKLYPMDNFTTGTGIWTELNPKVPRVTYVGINFVNKDTGWACGDLGTLIKTTDGGQTWSVIGTNTTSPLLKVSSYNGQVVIATGYDGLILKSSDGGDTFIEVPSGLGSGIDLWGLEMVNDTLGWACGATSLIKTTDSGQNWQIVNTPGYTGNFWWIDFMNEDYGFIAADGKVLRTIDGGDSWEIIQAGDNQSLYCIDVIDSLHIATAGYGGTGYSAKNLYSSDGGYTWINGGNLTTEDVNCIQYVNPDTGYLVMSGVSARKTTNRGQEWTTIQGISDNYEIQLLNNNVGYSAGTEVKISKAEGDLDVWHRLFINDNFSDVFFVNEQKGFVISSSGNSDYRGLYRTTDGGINWQSVSGAPDGVDLLFLDSLTGFLGASSSIYKTTDGGDTWYQTQGAAGGGKIFFINQTTGWTIHSHTIYKSTDTGENWITQISLPSDSYTSIFFVDSLNGWATSRYIWQTTDGGENWIERGDIPITFSTDIYFPNLDTGWIARYSSINPSFFRTTNAGINWTVIPEILTAWDICLFPDPIHFIVNGTSHRYITTDKGNSWIDITNDVPYVLNSIQAPSNFAGYGVGSLGLIINYNDTTYVPVELSFFSANLDGQDILLTWVTATETNNRGFEVQRSNVGGQLSVWETIEFVNGNGTTTLTHSYSFTNKNITPGKYCYRLRQIDFDGSYKYSKEIVVEVTAPIKYSLEQNYPNPFNPTTTISFSLPADAKVSLSVFDVLGREVTTLIKKTMTAGYYDIDFNASAYPSGVYLYRLRAEGDNPASGSNFNSVKKMIVIK